MAKAPNWSEAPEDATHWMPEGEGFVECWIKGFESESPMVIPAHEWEHDSSAGWSAVSASELPGSAIERPNRAVSTSINIIATEIHAANSSWWKDPVTGQPIRRNRGEMIALIHSELSEALEADRKNLMDDKLPHRDGLEVELADAMIRIFDMAGGLGLDLGGAMAEKLAFNKYRADHKPENRLKDGGKKY